MIWGYYSFVSFDYVMMQSICDYFNFEIYNWNEQLYDQFNDEHLIISAIFVGCNLKANLKYFHRETGAFSSKQ